MTAQAGELLVFKGNIYSMNCEPFSQFVQKNNLKLYFIATNSALWRGYFGEWEITDKKLYLTKISGNGKIRNQEKFRSGRLELRKKMKNGVITPQKNGHLLKILKEDCLEDIELSLKSLFHVEDKVFADWFSGRLVCPYGKMIQYIHLGYESVYESELHLEILNGELVEFKTVSNKLGLKLIKRLINFITGPRID